MDIREDLLRYYRWLRQYGLNDSHSGNASVRDSDRIWITPTGACADTLQANDLVPCTIRGSTASNPSLDMPLHLAVYRNNADTCALLHSHGPHSVALTMDGKDFVPADFEGQYYFGQVPVLDIPYDRYLQDAPDLVASALRDSPIAVVRGHGVYAAANDLNLAYKWACTLELSARTAFLARQAGTI